MKQINSFFKLMMFLLLTQSTYGMLSTTKKKPRLYRSISEQKTTLSRSISGKHKGPSNAVLKKSKSTESYSLTQKQADLRLANQTEENSLETFIAIDAHTINNIFAHGETLLIWACNNNQLSLVKELMKYKKLNINQQNNYAETALHYSARHKNKKIVKLLLQNPRTDSSITNNENRTARDVVEGNNPEDIHLRLIIFARIMLDLTVNKIRKDIQVAYFQQWIETSDSKTEQKNIIQQAVIDTKNALNADQDNQEEEEDRRLPNYAKIPSYANDEFIAKMFKLRLNGYK